MVAFNFQEKFADKIKSNHKRSTIRQSKRCKPGDTLQLYTGQRTKNCVLIAERKCQHVMGIRLDRSSPVDGKPQNYAFTRGNDHEAWSGLAGQRLTNLVRHEGFNSADEMFDFFESQYGLPFVGHIITWEPDHS